MLGMHAPAVLGKKPQARPIPLLNRTCCAMWLQTAEILMILRPESEPISDFQDYTLVAVIAVATHLMGTHAGDHHFLAALAQRFSQDATALHQVRHSSPIHFQNDPPPPPSTPSLPSLSQPAEPKWLLTQCSQVHALPVLPDCKIETKATQKSALLGARC